MTDAKKPKKPSFDFEALKAKASKLNETQWAMLAGGVFFFGYVLFEFVLVSPPPPVDQGLYTPMQQVQTETEEQRFKRENKNTHLPDGKSIPAKKIEEKTQLTQQVPFGDRELEFVIRLPKNWVMSEFARYGLPGQQNYAMLTNVARYFGPAIEDARPYLWVEAERIKRYMTAETWAKAYMIKRGITPEAMQITSETEVQALYVDVRDNYQSYAQRTLFRISGDTMVMVSFGVPISEYANYKDLMGLSLNSFRLLNEINREIEQKNNYKLLNILSFDYYSSWNIANEFTETALRPSVELHNPQEANNPTGKLLQGLILVNGWRNSAQVTPENCLDEVSRRLKRINLVLDKAKGKSKDLESKGEFKSASRTAYKAPVKTGGQSEQFGIVRSQESMTHQDVIITALDNGYYTVYLTLVSPPRGTNYVVWAQNMEAYDLLTRSLKVRGAPRAE